MHGDPNDGVTPGEGAIEKKARAATDEEALFYDQCVLAYIRHGETANYACARAEEALVSRRKALGPR